MHVRLRLPMELRILDLPKLLIGNSETWLAVQPTFQSLLKANVE